MEQTGRSVKVYYDREGDYLEVLFEQKPGYLRETEHDALMERVDMQGRIIGFSLLKASVPREGPLSVHLGKRVTSPRGRSRSVKTTKSDMDVKKSTRNTGKQWSDKEETQLRALAKENTPTRVIGLKLGRTENAVRSKASELGVSLKPTNQAPYNRRKK